MLKRGKCEYSEEEMNKSIIDMNCRVNGDIEINSMVIETFDTLFENLDEVSSSDKMNNVSPKKEDF